MMIKRRNSGAFLLLGIFALFAKKGVGQKVKQKNQ